MEKAQAQIEGQLGLVLDHFDDGFAPWSLRQRRSVGGPDG